MMAHCRGAIGWLLAAAVAGAVAIAAATPAASPVPSPPVTTAPAAAGAPARPTPAAPPAAAAPAHPLRASGPAFGVKVEIEVRDLPRDAAEAAVRAAIAEAGEVERLTDATRPDSEVAALNAGAGRGPRRLDPRLFQALTRALDFCNWSEGRQGPLGRELHRLWGRGSDTVLPAPPSADAVELAAAASACRHLALDPAKETAALDAGSALDLADFSIGLAVDRAIAVLRQHGSANAFVQIGPLRRGIGGGRGGRGWPVDLPALGGLLEPLGRVFLRDQALAVAEGDDHPLRIGNEFQPAFINQRTGQPVAGTVAALAVTALAIDAQALAATMAITNSQEGSLLMGSIRPRPSILWLLGSGSGAPLLVDYRWSEVAKR
jgi:FAD:protein FMN transferase